MPDSRAAASVLDTWLTQSLGRPAAEAASGEESVTVTYTTAVGDPEREQAIRDEYAQLLADTDSIEDARAAAALLNNNGPERTM